MKILLSALFFLFLSNACFSQRWITEKSTGNYVTDSTGAVVTGTQAVVRAWAVANMDIEDTATYQIVNVAPQPSSVLMIYMPDDAPPENIPYIPVAPTSRILKMQSRIPVGSKRVYMVYDRTLNKIAVFNRTTISYITPSP